MVKLFISYRRSDSPDSTARLYDELRDRFGDSNVIRDIDTIPIAVPFPQFIEDSLRGSDVALAVIGPNWLNATQPDGTRRIDDPRDFVRLEIATALRLHIRLILIFVSNARPIDGDSLPEEIRGLALQNGVAVRPDPDFHSDVIRLLSKLDQLLGRTTPKRDTKSRVDDLERTIKRQEMEVKLQEIEADWRSKRLGNLIAPTSAWMVVVPAIIFVGIIAWTTLFVGKGSFSISFVCLIALFFWSAKYFVYRADHEAYQARRREVTTQAENVAGALTELSGAEFN